MMHYRAELCSASPCHYHRLDPLTYPFHDKTITVTECGHICMDRGKINFRTEFVAQNIGVEQIADRIWLMSFMEYDLGFFDDEACRLEFIPEKVLPMFPV